MTTANVPNSSVKIYYNLEAMRGFCAFMVAFYHIPWASSVNYLPFVHNAWLFVDFFFVLSGFVIAYSYCRPSTRAFDLSTFMVRRFFRLYPLHLLMLVLSFVLLIARDVVVPALSNMAPRGDFTGEFWWAFLNNITLTHSLGLTRLATLNVPSWSISAEFWTYLTFAGCCLLFATAARRVAAMFTIGMAALALLLYLNWPNGLATPIYFGFLRCLASFGVGTAVWLVAHHLPASLPSRGLDAGYALLTIVIVLLLGLPLRESTANVAVIPLFAVVIYLFAFDEGSLVKRALETRPMRALGEWSYSIYMVHALWTSLLGFVLNRFYSGTTDIPAMGFRLAVPLWLGDLFVVGYVIVVLATSAATFAWVEKPWREYGREYGRRVAARAMAAMGA